jgi:hypothetical protein
VLKAGVKGLHYGFALPCPFLLGHWESRSSPLRGADTARPSSPGPSWPGLLAFLPQGSLPSPPQHQSCSELKGGCVPLSQRGPGTPGPPTRSKQQEVYVQG